MPPRRRRAIDPEELAAESLALINGQAAARERIAATVLAQVAAAVAALVDWYDPRQVDAFVETAAEAVQLGRLATADLTEAYVRDQLAAAGAAAARGSVEPAELPRGIPLTEEWARPVKEYRYARLRGLDALEAEERADRRAERMADMDLSMAARDAARDVLAPLDVVTGWRRIFHPELSAGGTCGLCIVAADRLYKRGELLPLHDRCKCTVLPVVQGQPDPGKTLNGDALAQLYGEAGGNTRAKLARTRYAVHEHGELGPVLREEGQHFRDADDVADDTGRPAELQPAEVPPLAAAASPADLRDLGDEELALLVSDPAVAADADRLEAVLAELDRRDAEERTTAELAAADQQTDDEFLAAVRAAQAARNGYDDEAEAAGLDADEYDPPRGGASSAQEVREGWELFVHEQMLAAEDATRGNLLSPAGKRAGAAVYALFTGDAVQSIRWASEELIRWWEDDPTRRMSWPEWRAQAAGTSSPAARKSRQRFDKALQRWEDTRRGRNRRRAS